MTDDTVARELEADDLRHTSLRLGQALAALVIALAAMIALERFGPLLVATTPHGAGEWLLAVAKALPEFLAVLALWWIRGALAAFARGEFFTLALALALRRAGIAIAIAGAYTVALLPSLAKAFGSPPGYLIAFDVSAFVLAAVGIALTLIAHVLKRAAALQAELDEIF